MNVLIYHVASGQALFSGALLIGLAVLVGMRGRGPWWRFSRTLLAGAGVALCAVSATPLPIWFWTGAAAIVAGWLGLEGRDGGSQRVLRGRWVLRGSVLAVLGLGVTMDAPYHRMPAVPPLGNPVVEVVGDSLSAGMGESAKRVWPAILARRHGLVIRNRARAGATAATARAQAREVTETGALVLVAIGGNDILAGTPSETFARALDGLLAELHAYGRTVVMLELPLPPFANAYGAAQRRLARQHGVWLVPRRLVIGVLTSPGATLDTVHLSPEGHALMAEAIWRVLEPAFSRGGS
jgi:acyl-CoA thioesterase-1